MGEGAGRGIFYCTNVQKKFWILVITARYISDPTFDYKPVSLMGFAFLSKLAEVFNSSQFLLWLKDLLSGLPVFYSIFFNFFTTLHWNFFCPYCQNFINYIVEISELCIESFLSVLPEFYQLAGILKLWTERFWKALAWQLFFSCFQFLNIFEIFLNFLKKLLNLLKIFILTFFNF